MAAKAIPDGYHSITPYLIVEGASRLIEFLKQGLSAKEAFAPMVAPDGRIGHAEMRLGDSMVMLADATPEWKALSSMVHYYVDDVDAQYQRAIKAGATSVREPADQFYGDRSATVKDPCGNFWSIATHKEDVSREELDRRVAEMMQKKSG
jgi:uncharacterized glyoxalase superfamily protein PhnB